MNRNERYGNDDRNLSSRDDWRTQGRQNGRMQNRDEDVNIQGRHGETGFFGGRGGGFEEETRFRFGDHDYNPRRMVGVGEGRDRYEDFLRSGDYGSGVNPGYGRQAGFDVNDLAPVIAQVVRREIVNVLTNPQFIQTLTRQSGRSGDETQGLGRDSTLSSLFGGGRTQQRQLPKNFKRSEERIREDVYERIISHPDISSQDIEVRVHDGTVTLTGTVQDRHEKLIIEHLVDNVLGVQDIRNEIRVQRMTGANSETQRNGNQQRTEVGRHTTS